MADAATDDNDFGKELAAAFAADEEGATPTAPVAPVEEPKPGEATPPAPNAPKEEPKPNEAANTEVPKEGEPAAPADPAKPAEEDPTKPKAPEAPGAPEEPKPLTKDDVTSIIQNIRTEERTSGQALETTTKEVLDAYYPEGLSNTLVDQNSGKELKTPQDVVDASGGNMSMEDAAQWLMNEQFKLDQSVAQIKDDAKKIAETTLNFERDSTAVLQKYDPLFKAYPQLQRKVFDKLMQQVKIDEKKGVILSSPDVMDHYDFYLEPYQKAFEFSTNQAATNPPAPAPGAPGAPAPAPTPGIDDRLDEGGDGGQSPVDDPNDFAQQVTKELTRGL